MQAQHAMTTPSTFLLSSFLQSNRTVVPSPDLAFPGAGVRFRHILSCDDLNQKNNRGQNGLARTTAAITPLGATSNSQQYNGRTR